MKKKVLIVFGTRPEAIKMAPLIHNLKAEPELFETNVCVTAQHREMLDQALEMFDIRPDIDLDLMKPGQDLTDITSSILIEIRKVLQKNKPDIVLVHGDTTTAFATSLACFYKGIDVGHVEAGLRTFDIYAPFPEEFNRQAVSKISKYHFSPTSTSKQNLINEGVNESDILVTGNTVIDALKSTIKKIKSNSKNRNLINKKIRKDVGFDFEREKFVLITAHRRENFGKGFVEICQAIKQLSNDYPEIDFVYSVHLNPNVQKPVLKILANLNNVHLVEPLDYEPFVWLLYHCHFVLTDSGGIQEEAPSFGKPVLVMREVTERPEAVTSGVVKLVGSSKEKIVDSASQILGNVRLYENMSKANSPYGDGFASDRIVKFLNNI